MNLKITLIAGALVVAAASQAAFIYGLSPARNSNPAGIYKIDVATGTTTLAVTGASIGNNSNGLALDLGTNEFFYTSNEVSLRKNIGGVETVLGNLVGNTASATWGGDAYWYVDNDTDDLRKVTLNAGRTAIVSNVKVADLTGTGTSSYGDIAYSGGKIYGINGSRYWVYNVGTSALEVNLANPKGTQQLGFFGNSLYSIDTDTDVVSSVNLATGFHTDLSTLSLNIEVRDAASAVPEPASMLALAAGAGILAARRRRKA